MGSKQLGVPRPINIHGALDDIVNWRKLILATYKLAKGGQNTVNQYGTPIKTLPNMEAIKFLFEHRFGRAEQRITSTHADKELLLKLSEFAD